MRFVGVATKHQDSSRPRAYSPWNLLKGLSIQSTLRVQAVVFLPQQHSCELLYLVHRILHNAEAVIWKSVRGTAQLLTTLTNSDSTW